MKGNRATNVVWNHTIVNKENRRYLNGHQSAAIWFTGLSGAGKSTLANALEARLHGMGTRTYILDGDNIRYGLNKDLGFGDEDRRENIRRIGEVAKLFVDAGVIVLNAFISPFRDDRETVRRLFQPSEFIEVYVKCPLEECERRDVKGHYKRARAGEIRSFTGIDSPYEEPENPEVTIDTARLDLNEAVDLLIRHLLDNGYLIAEKSRARNARVKPVPLPV